MNAPIQWKISTCLRPTKKNIKKFSTQFSRETPMGVELPDFDLIRRKIIPRSSWNDSTCRKPEWENRAESWRFLEIPNEVGISSLWLSFSEKYQLRRWSTCKIRKRNIWRMKWHYSSIYVFSTFDIFIKHNFIGIFFHHANLSSKYVSFSYIGYLFPFFVFEHFTLVKMKRSEFFQFYHTVGFEI